jgi:hypothetical protein
MLGANRIWMSSAGLCSPGDADGGLMELFLWEVATNSFATQIPVVPLCNIPAGQKT